MNNRDRVGRGEVLQSDYNYFNIPNNDLEVTFTYRYLYRRIDTITAGCKGSQMRGLKPT